jgi:transposase
MNFFVGLDISKEKFDACGIGNKGERVFAHSCSMDRQGFEQLIGYLPKDKTSFLLGMESTASYHIALFTYLAAQDYSVVVISRLLINNFSKRSLGKTKTDKKEDALTIAQFLLQEKETLSVKTPDT